MTDHGKQNDPRYTASLSMPEKWAKTKRKKDGKVQGFTFRGEGGLLFLRLGPPEPVEGQGLPTWRYTFELSHTHHLTPHGRNNASINDRVFFAEGSITLLTDDPKVEYFERRLSNLIDEYNIAIMRVGRIFEIPEDCLKQKDSNKPYQPGGYTLLGVKMDVNRWQFEPGLRTVHPEAYNNAEVDWELRVRYMIRNAHPGFAGKQQIGGVDRYGHRGTSTNYVPEDRVGPEVLPDSASDELSRSVEALVESTAAHFEMLRSLAHTAADSSLDTKVRVEAAQRLNNLVSMKAWSYGAEKGYHYIATPKDPVDDLTAAVKSFITVMPDIVE
jgi:hypothetical protein